MLELSKIIKDSHSWTPVKPPTKKKAAAVFYRELFPVIFLWSKKVGSCFSCYPDVFISHYCTFLQSSFCIQWRVRCTYYYYSFLETLLSKEKLERIALEFLIVNKRLNHVTFKSHHLEARPALQGTHQFSVFYHQTATIIWTDHKTNRSISVIFW